MIPPLVSYVEIQESSRRRKILGVFFAVCIFCSLYFLRYTMETPNCHPRLPVCRPRAIVRMAGSSMLSEISGGGLLVDNTLNVLKVEL